MQPYFSGRAWKVGERKKLLLRGMAIGEGNEEHPPGHFKPNVEVWSTIERSEVTRAPCTCTEGFIGRFDSQVLGYFGSGNSTIGSVCPVNSAYCWVGRQQSLKHSFFSKGSGCRL